MTSAAVFDCVIYVQAVGNRRGPARACYDLVRDGWLTLYVSPDVIAEVADVLGRPKVRRKLPDLTDEAVGSFLRDVLARATMLDDVPEAFSLERDPKDERYINLAVAAGASYLVTWDRDLLDLMGDDGFRQQFPGLTILEPPALLRLVRRDSKETPPA